MTYVIVDVGELSHLPWVTLTQLRHRDVATLLELVRGSYALLDLSEFRPGMLRLVREAVPCTLVAYNELEPDTQRAVVLFEPAEAMIFDDPGAVLASVAPSSPIITRYAATRDGRAYKLSDFLTRRELHATPLWKDALGPLGVEYQIAFTLPSQPSVLIGITLNDGDRDFRERDRTLLNLARPHLVQAYRNAQIHTETRARLAALDRGLEATGLAAIMLRRDGRVRAASPQAERMLKGAFGRRPAARGQLPADLKAWVAERRVARGPGDNVPLIVPGDGGRLLVRFVRRRGGIESDVLLLERSVNPLATESLRALGLTPRESEALRLAALGSTSEAIADDLSISRATVRKHFENIYRKLGVQSRAAAVATAWAGAETKTILDETG